MLSSYMNLNWALGAKDRFYASTVSEPTDETMNIKKSLECALK